MCSSAGHAGLLAITRRIRVEWRTPVAFLGKDSWMAVIGRLEQRECVRCVVEST